MKEQFIPQQKTQLCHPKNAHIIHNIRLHICQNCLTPLHNFTKIMVQIHIKGEEQSEQQEQDWQMLCVPCFSKWTPPGFDSQPFKSQNCRYWVCQRTDEGVVGLDGWSVDEIFWLIHLTESGIFDGSKLEVQFYNRTGIIRTKAQLQKKCTDIFRQTLSQGQQKQILSLTFPRQDNAIQLPRQEDSSIQHQEGGQQTAKKRKRLMKFLNYQHLPEYNRSYPDNHHSFKAKIMANSSHLLNKFNKSCYSQENQSANIDYHQQRQLRVLTHELSKHSQKDLSIQQLLAEISDRYSRKNIYSRNISVEQKSQHIQQIMDLAHPELSKLLQRVDIKEEIRNILSIKQERDQLLSDIRRDSKAIKGKINKFSVASGMDHGDEGVFAKLE